MFLFAFLYMPKTALPTARREGLSAAVTRAVQCARRGNMATIWTSDRPIQPWAQSFCQNRSPREDGRRIVNTQFDVFYLSLIDLNKLNTQNAYWNLLFLLEQNISGPWNAIRAQRLQGACSIPTVYVLDVCGSMVLCDLTMCLLFGCTPCTCNAACLWWAGFRVTVTITKKSLQSVFWISPTIMS